MKKTNILFICNEFPPYPHGGIGIFIKNMTTDLVNAGFECTVIGLYPVERTFEEYFGNVRVIRLKDSSSFVFGQLKVFKILYEVIRKIRLSLFIRNLERKNRFDLIESYEWNGPLAFKPKTKLLIRLHGSNTAYSMYEGKQVSRFISYHEKRNLSFADKVVAVSDHMWSLTQTTFPDLKISKHVIYNSYNANVFNCTLINERKSNRILFVGKFHERKGVFELFRILDILLGLNLNYEFEFVGPFKSQDFHEVISLVKVDFQDRITFTGPLSQLDLSKRYLQSSLMIMPSRAEAFGLTAIEAMSCGCIVAMTNLPVAYEIIDDDISGLIINPTAYKETAQRIHELLKNESLVKGLRENAINKARSRFSSEVVLKQNILMYKEIVK